MLSNKEKGIKKTWLEIYGLAVCFVAVVCALFYLGSLGWNIVEISAPQFTMSSSDWEDHQDDEAFKESLIRQHSYSDDKNKYVPPEGAALTQAREKSFARALRTEAREAFQEMIKSIIALAIALIVIVIHWKIATRARHSAS